MFKEGLLYAGEETRTSQARLRREGMDGGSREIQVAVSLPRSGPGGGGGMRSGSCRLLSALRAALLACGTTEKSGVFRQCEQDTGKSLWCPGFPRNRWRARLVSSPPLSRGDSAPTVEP